MIKWNINYFGNRRDKILKCLCDIMIAKECFSKVEYFIEYKNLIEGGTDFSQGFPIHLTNDLLNGVQKINWIEK
jgi:hypothetical protein